MRWRGLSKPASLKDLDGTSCAAALLYDSWAPFYVWGVRNTNLGPGIWRKAWLAKELVSASYKPNSTYVVTVLRRELQSWSVACEMSLPDNSLRLWRTGEVSGVCSISGCTGSFRMHVMLHLSILGWCSVILRSWILIVITSNWIILYKGVAYMQLGHCSRIAFIMLFCWLQLLMYTRIFFLACCKAIPWVGSSFKYYKPP